MKLYRIEIVLKNGQVTGCAEYMGYTTLVTGWNPLPLPSGRAVRRISVRDRFWFTQAGWDKYGSVLWRCLHNEIAAHIAMMGQQATLKERTADMASYEKITYSDEWQVAIRILKSPLGKNTHAIK